MRLCFCPASPSLTSENIHFQQILNVHSPVKRNHSLLEYSTDNDTQMSELEPSGPSCFHLTLILLFTTTTFANSVDPDQMASEEGTMRSEVILKFHTKTFRN